MFRQRKLQRLLSEQLEYGLNLRFVCTYVHNLVGISDAEPSANARATREYTGISSDLQKRTDAEADSDSDDGADAEAGAMAGAEAAALILRW